MYGLLIENISQYIQARYSIEKWNDIRRLAQIEETAFSVHKTYPDVYTKNIINKACQVRRDAKTHTAITAPSKGDKVLAMISQRLLIGN